MRLAPWRSSRQSQGTCVLLFISLELSSHIPVGQPPKELAFPTALGCDPLHSLQLMSALFRDFLIFFLTEVPNFTSAVCLAGQQ